MAAKDMYETVKQAIQDLIAPDLERIKGQLTGLDARVDAVRTEVAAVRAEVAALEKRMEAALGAVNDRLDTLKERVTDALDIRERLAVVEAKLPALG
jgi:predicted nuclease with TOPRIM domain